MLIDNSFQISFNLGYSGKTHPIEYIKHPNHKRVFCSRVWITLFSKKKFRMSRMSRKKTPNRIYRTPKTQTGVLFRVCVILCSLKKKTQLKCMVIYRNFFGNFKVCVTKVDKRKICHFLHKYHQKIEEYVPYNPSCNFRKMRFIECSTHRPNNIRRVHTEY